MIWVVIAGFFAIVGSVLMLKPSARDSRLARLRMDALKEGLHVRQIIWQPESAKTGVYESINATSYTLVRPDTNQAGSLRFSVVKQKGWETTHLPASYSWHQQGSAADGQAVSAQLPLLQDELLLLEVWENKVLIMVKEQPNATAASYKEFMAMFL